MKLKFPSVRPWLRLFLASACLMLVACGARVDLMGSVPEEEANEVLAALLKADIAAEKTAGKEGMVGVRVDATQVGRALEVMRENGLPRERFAGMAWSTRGTCCQVTAVQEQEHRDCMPRQLAVLAGPACCCLGKRLL